MIPSQNLCATWLLKARRPFRFWIVFSHLISVRQKCPAVCHSQKLKAENWGPLLAMPLAVLCWVGSPRWWKLWVCTHFLCLLKPPNLWKSYSTLEVRHAVPSVNTKNPGVWSKVMSCKMENAAGFLQGGGRPTQPHQSMNNCCCGSRGKRGVSCGNPSNIMCPCAYIY